MNDNEITIETLLSKTKQKSYDTGYDAGVATTIVALKQILKQLHITSFDNAKHEFNVVVSVPDYNHDDFMSSYVDGLNHYLKNTRIKSKIIQGVAHESIPAAVLSFLNKK